MESNQAELDYSFQHFRAKRLKLDVEGLDEISPKWLNEKINSLLYGNFNEVHVVEEVARVKKIALEKFEELRSKE